MMNPDMTTCPKGHTNPANHKFCSECRGQPIAARRPERPDKKKCPNGHENPAHHYFCGECGESIATPVQVYERKVEKPLAIAALIFLAGYSVEVLCQPHGMARTVVSDVQNVTWAVFVVDYLIRLRKVEAGQRRRWFLRHLFDLAIVALPLLRPLRLLRLVYLVNALQRAVGSAIRGKVIIYAVFGAVLLVYVSSLAVLDAERGHNPEFKTFVDGLWWSFATITTVGYGDKVPVTLMGRFMAVLLMIGAIGLVGSITATFASWIVRRVADEDAASSAPN